MASKISSKMRKCRTCQQGGRTCGQRGRTCRMHQWGTGHVGRGGRMHRMFQQWGGARHVGSSEREGGQSGSRENGQHSGGDNCPCMYLSPLPPSLLSRLADASFLGMCV